MVNINAAFVGGVGYGRCMHACLGRQKPVGLTSLVFTFSSGCNPSRVSGKGERTGSLSDRRAYRCPRRVIR
jgi:hypothetical protein